MKKLLVLLMLTTTLVAQRGGGSGGGHRGGGTSENDTTGVPMLRTGVKLVVVDIVVTDKNHTAVHGLKAEDFSLLENNASQTFRSFEEHTAPTSAELASLPALPKLPEGVFSNFASARDSGPLNILLLDKLNTPAANQMDMIRQIHQFLNSAPAGRRVAIFGLTDHLALFQGFSDDPAQLRATITKSGNLRDVPILSGNQTQTSDLVANALGDDADQDMLTTMKEFESRNTAFQTKLRAKYTLDALNQLARYLAALPGRKNLIWFSGSFPVNILPDTTKTGFDIFSGIETSEKEFRETTALLSRSQVSMYPIYVKGVEGDAIFNADNAGVAGRGLGGISASLNHGDQDRYDEHSTMLTMAADTGGKATINTNDLASAVADDLNDGSNYYTIAYSPTDTNWDGRLRNITVKLRQSGYKLSYRRGYFADDVDPLAGLTASPALTRNMRIALVHGGPEPTQLLFSTQVRPASNAAETEIASRNNPDKLTKGPYRRFRVDFAINPKELHFTQDPNGTRHETLEFITYVYSASGHLMNSMGNTIHADITPEQYEQFLKNGVPYRQEISVPAKGAATLRIAMQDVEADKVGAVEIPLSSVAKLAPLEASVNSPAK